MCTYGWHVKRRRRRSRKKRSNSTSVRGMSNKKIEIIINQFFYSTSSDDRLPLIIGNFKQFEMKKRNKKYIEENDDRLKGRER